MRRVSVSEMTTPPRSKRGASRAVADGSEEEEEEDLELEDEDGDGDGDGDEEAGGRRPVKSSFGAQAGSQGGGRVRESGGEDAGAGTSASAIGASSPSADCDAKGPAARLALRQRALFLTPRASRASLCRCGESTSEQPASRAAGGEGA